jgi:DNA-binding NarL/FixJ family response regulator
MIKVAVVEDDRTTRESLEAFIGLSPDNQCVCTCTTAEEALEILPQHQPDVVLMDIQLPRMSGIDCVAQLKELRPSVQVIMVTVYEDPDRIFRALRAGASGYLLKRAKPEQVLSAIQDVRQGGVPMSSEIARKVIAYFRAQETAMADVENLSVREREVLDLVVCGLSTKVIADRLSLTLEGLRWHMKNIYQKLHVHSRAEVMARFRAQK